MEGFGNIHHFVRHAVFEDGIADALIHKRRVNTEADSLFVRDGIGFLQSNGIGKTHPLDFGLQRLPAHNASVTHIVGWRAKLFEKGLR